MKKIIAYMLITPAVICVTGSLIWAALCVPGFAEYISVFIVVAGCFFYGFNLLINGGDREMKNLRQRVWGELKGVVDEHLMTGYSGTGLWAVLDKVLDNEDAKINELFGKIEKVVSDYELLEHLLDKDGLDNLNALREVLDER